jgi:hypothetical protein
MLSAGRASVPNGLQLPRAWRHLRREAIPPKPAYTTLKARERRFELSGYDAEAIDYPLLPNVIAYRNAVAQRRQRCGAVLGSPSSCKIWERELEDHQGASLIRNMSATMVQDPATVLCPSPWS